MQTSIQGSHTVRPLHSTPPRQPATKDIPQEAEDYVEERVNAREEPASMHGILYEEKADGSWKTLEKPGHTQPDIPSGGSPDIPSDAVANNRVVLSVDGIHQTFNAHVSQIWRLLEGSGPDPGYGANVHQPVIGVHEGVGPSNFSDGYRIFKDIEFLKGLQGHYMGLKWVKRHAYKADPSVKTVHDEIRQSLEAGRDVQVVAHSGGGAETVLALSILAREDKGKFKKLIHDRVRILSMAAATSRKDYTLAGVQGKNIYYTGSKHDPVWRLCRHYIHPWFEAGHIPMMAVAIRLALNHHNYVYHAPDYIFHHSMQPDGTQRIQTFLDGGDGGDYPLP